ncbi:c6 zinc finger domain-containing protein [Moniliophthora roreri]|nr:c6 zinc finger domain-containing protein [Moniliophthora roreri]
MSTTGATKFEGVIRFHTKSRSGCLTCRKRRIKRPRNEQGEERQRQETVLCKPLTAPTPIPMSITSRQIMHHFTAVTSASFDSEPGCIPMLCTIPPQLSWYNPHLFHALLSCASLHLGRLYPTEPKWLYLASAHRKAAIDALPGATNPNAKYLTVGLFTIYTISSSFSSSPENIFPLMTSLHNVFPTFEGRHMYEDQRLKVIDPFSVSLQVDLVEPLGHLQQIYNFRMLGSELEPQELVDPSIRAAYRNTVEAFYVVYRLSRTGYETKSAVLWPVLFGRKFRDLLNERRQRALVVLYYYLGMLKSIGERCWWANEAVRCRDYVYGLLDVGWRGWVLQYDGVTKDSATNSTRLTY